MLNNVNILPTPGRTWVTVEHEFEDAAISIIQIAIRAGFKFPPEWTQKEIQAVSSHEAWYEWEETGENLELLAFAESSAASFLETIAPAGYWIGWDENEFGMWKQ